MARRPTGGTGFVSAYATAHPWEDFAETWAHYLHIIDTLEMASALGLKVEPSLPGAGTIQEALTTWKAHGIRSIRPLSG